MPAPEEQPMAAAEITLRLPAESRYVATARVTTTSLAAEFDHPIDWIEELRVAVNELVATLVEWAEDHGGDTLELTFRLDDGWIEIDGSVAAPTAGADADDGLDALTGEILSKVTDEFEIAGGQGRLLKRRGG